MDGPFQRIAHTRPIPDMPRSITIVDTEEKVDRAIAELLRYDVLGFDVETWNSRLRHIPAFNPTDGAKMRLSQWGTPDGDAYVFDNYKISPTYLYRMFPNTSYLLVGQNLMFELTFLMHELDIFEFGDIWDTMIAAQVLNKGDVAGAGYIPVGLDAIAKRELNVILPKDEQASHWYKTDLSQSQLQYAARDAIVVLPIYQRQRAALVSQSQVRVSEIEFGAIPPVAWMKNNGIYLNPEKWEAQFHRVETEVQSVKYRLWELLGSQGSLFGEGIQTINLNSRPKIMEAFQRKGIEIPLDRNKNVTLSGKLLKPIEHFEEVKLYMKYVKLQKALSSFGLSWIDAINPVTGRLHGSLKIIGAETGRMSGVKPNLMQVKKEDEYRNCFEAQNGWVYIDTDYSQCELRILAEYSRDPRLLEAYDNDYDLHRFSASLIYKKTMDLVTKEERGVAKNLNFGIVYGIGPTKFATDSGIPIDEGQKIMDYYLREAYPGMNRWLEGRASDILYTMQATTMSGRIRRYRGDLRDNEFKAATQRNAKNLPIQGTNADITKRAMRLLYDRVIPNRNKFKMILPVHDELLNESRPDFAREGQYHVETAMLQAEGEFLKRVKTAVDTNITRVWCKEPSKEQLAEAEAIING
jgi:DNA polymerase-1